MPNILLHTGIEIFNRDGELGNVHYIPHTHTQTLFLVLGCWKKVMTYIAFTARLVHVWLQKEMGDPVREKRHMRIALGCFC